MSHEDVEVARRLTEALNARDLDRYYFEFFDAAMLAIRDGRVVRGEDYFDRAEALEAVGPSE